MATNVVLTETTNELDKTPSEFKELSKSLADQFRHILKLNTEVARLGKGEKIRYSKPLMVGGKVILSEGLEISKKEMRSLESQYVKELMALPRYFREAKKKKKTTRQGGNNGFNKPMYVTDELVNFFRSTKLGPAYQKVVDAEGKVYFQETGQQLGQCLELFLGHKITSSSLLTPLFSIYAQLNNMQNPDEKSFLRATPEMMKHFGVIFKKLTQEDTEALAEVNARVVKGEKVDPKEIEKAKAKIFNPERLKYSRVPSIVSHCRVSPESLDQTHKDNLAREDVVARVREEQTRVSDTLAFYRAQKDAAKVTAKPKGK